MTVPRVGIVGGAGQIGSALLKTLNTDCKLAVFGICRSNVSAARLASQGLRVRIAHTENAVQLAESTRDLDILVNCALPRYRPCKTIGANHRLANSLAVACAGKYLIHLSSVAVYGDFIPAHKELFRNPQPDSFYGRQKLQMESLLLTLANKHSMKCMILRIGHVYGAECRWSEAIFDMINDGFRLPFDGQLLSNAIGIKNLIAGIQAALFGELRQATFNLTDAPQTTWRDVFDLHSQASGHPAVEPLSHRESEDLFRDRKRWSRTGMTARIAWETLRWAKRLPASYIASVPTLKSMTQWAVAQTGSETLDAKLWAVYCKRVASGIDANAKPEIHPTFLSEPAPGPCLSYEGSGVTENLAALQAWHHAISEPDANGWRSIQ
jgi:nucleoside-diphosphate-sugar epimerase